MPFIPNDDGTYRVTDVNGNEVANGVPAEYVPPGVLAAMAGTNVGVTVEEQIAEAGRAVQPTGEPEVAPVEPPPPDESLAAPPPQPATDLYNQPEFQLPPSLFGMATAGPGGFADAAAEERAKREQADKNARAAELHGQVPGAPGATTPVLQPKLRYDASTDRFVPNKPSTSAQIGAQSAAMVPDSDAAVDMTRGVLDEQIRGRDVYVQPQPAAWIPQSMSVERQAAISPETKDQRELAYNLAITGARYHGAKLANEMANQAVQYEQQRQSAQDELDNIKAKEAERDSVLWPKLAIVQKNAEQIRSFKIDPEAYWQRKGVVGSVLTNIGIALGAMGSALTGGPNQVYQKVRAEIEDEIGAQRATLDAMKGAQESDLNTLAQMRQLFGSPEAAMSATRALLLESMAAQTRKMATEIGSQEALAKGEELASKYSLEAANEFAKTEQLEGGAIRQTDKFRPEVKGGRVHIGPKNLTDTFKIFQGVAAAVNRPVEDIIRLYAHQTNSLGVDPKTAVLQQNALKMELEAGERSVRDPVTGQVLYANNKDTANKYQTALSSMSEMKQNLARIQEIYKKHSAGVATGANTEARGEIQTLVSRNTFLAQDAIVRNALQQHEEKRVAPLTGETALDFVNRVNEQVGWETAQKVMDLDIKNMRSQLHTSWLPGSGFATEPVEPRSTTYSVPKGAVKVEPKPAH